LARDTLNRGSFRRFAAYLAVLLSVASWSINAHAAPKLDAVLSRHLPETFFPGATRYERVKTAKLARVITSDKRVVGYVFLNTDFDSAIGYSGKPISILIAIDLKGKIAGAKLIKHTEPIVLAGIPEAKITNFIDGYKNFDVVGADAQANRAPPPVDIVSGATVTVLVIDDSIRNSAIAAARAAGIAGSAIQIGSDNLTRTIDTSSKASFDWLGMIADGSVARLKLTVGDVNEAFRKLGNKAAIDRPMQGAENGAFIELFVASLAVPAIARSLLGEAEYGNLQKRLKPGDNAFLIMGSGPFSFKGSGYVRGGIFDRVQVVQDRASIRFRDRGHKRLRQVKADGAPKFREVGIFRISSKTEFDPARPWRLQLLVPLAVGALKKAFTSFELAYRLPEKFVRTERAAVTPAAVTVATTPKPDASQSSARRTDLWQRIWQQKFFDVMILSTAIMVLTVIFFFQDYLVKYPVLTRRIRDGFLLFTLFWIGWYAQAQLSVVNVLVFANALIDEFRWEYFLREPLIFVLWCSVASSLLFWGRGAFCGWLCPFGALQELLNRVAKALKVPQFRVPWAVHERLWPLKYLIFLGLLGYSVYSLAGAEQLAEVEPFKTAIVLRFIREWPFVIFALALLGAGLFVERFYCRYLCPLGAALAIPGKLSMFNWLKRYRNCGDPCHLCAQDCMVQAITPLGDINPNECLHCLNCQVKYFDASVCPVMVLKQAKTDKTTDNPTPAATEIGLLERAKDLYRRPRRLGRSRDIETEPSNEP
jgi:NosR/NirI family nitrous oxide reductase transcriptional regulator